MRINPSVSEWLNLLFRWAHIFAAILWVGTTYFFTWLDGRLSEDERESAARDERGEVWMVHSGGFYVVGKERRPGTRPLHWFRYEAALTWLTGFVLLVVVYYMGGALIDPDVLDISPAVGSLIGLGALVAAWLVYDLLMRSPLSRNQNLFAGVAYALVVAASYGLTRVFSGRAAYIHLGAMMGTIMVANVWMLILPAQRRMIAATKEGRAPDSALAAQAKLRSKHNTFMAVPVVFTMISNHFPVATYGHDYNWLILAALVLVGWFAAYFIRRA